MNLFKRRKLKTYLPGYANDMIENAHGRIIDLRKEKTELLESIFLGDSLRQQKISVIDEQILQWEEVIKLWTGKLDPVRNKLLWSVVVPILISTIVPLILFYFFGKNW